MKILLQINSGKAYVFAARGGLYAGTPLDGQTGYVRRFLAFLGITDVEFVYAEGLNMGEARKETTLAEAEGRPAALTLSDNVTTAI
jgi:FMN-dependent NADH-azoreductase